MSTHEGAQLRGDTNRTVLRMTRVTQRYGVGAQELTALHDVSLTVDEGEMVAVMGSSGSGKSTLLAVAGGLQTPTSGTVEVAGEELSDLSESARATLRRRSLGFVFQDYNLIPTLTASENITLPLELDGMGRRAARRAATEALTNVGLGERGAAFPDDLSGGEQQRVAIARAVVGGRRLILADEPTGALDSATGEQVMRMLRARVDAGAAAVLVTHEPRHAAWADRIVFLRDGKLIDESRRDRVDDALTNLG